MYDVEGNALEPGDIVLFQTGTSLSLVRGIVRSLNDMHEPFTLEIVDFSQTYGYTRRPEQVLLRSDAFRGQPVHLIAELYNPAGN